MTFYVLVAIGSQHNSIKTQWMLQQAWHTVMPSLTRESVLLSMVSAKPAAQWLHCSAAELAAAAVCRHTMQERLGVLVLQLLLTNLGSVQQQ